MEEYCFGLVVAGMPDGDLVQLSPPNKLSEPAIAALAAELFEVGALRFGQGGKVGRSGKTP